MIKTGEYGEVWPHVTMVALFLDDIKTNDDGEK